MMSPLYSTDPDILPDVPYDRDSGALAEAVAECATSGNAAEALDRVLFPIIAGETQFGCIFTHLEGVDGKVIDVVLLISPPIRVLGLEEKMDIDLTKISDYP